MKDNLSSIRKLIQEGELNTAIEQLTTYIQSDTTDNDEPYYLLRANCQFPCLR